MVELGPGDGSLTKVLIETFKKFPLFESSTKIFLYEKSKFLKKVQKENINNDKITWIDNFDKIKQGPIIFFGNEFFDAIPIKQFLRQKNNFQERCYMINSHGLHTTYRKALSDDIANIKSFKSLNKLTFIEYPKQGFNELDKIVRKISKLSGGILLIDYGYLDSFNGSTLQAIMKNRKIKFERLVENLGKADITYLVNFNLLKEYFLKKFKSKKNCFTKVFLEKMNNRKSKDFRKKNDSKTKKIYGLDLI